MISNYVYGFLEYIRFSSFRINGGKDRSFHQKNYMYILDFLVLPTLLSENTDSGHVHCVSYSLICMCGRLIAAPLNSVQSFIFRKLILIIFKLSALAFSNVVLLFLQWPNAVKLQGIKRFI
uniref:Glutathione peroxidase n=1 Tax=Rhizophora mucronata TaxID=61149 RepID=A0A2P2KM53_RHIMU